MNATVLQIAERLKEAYEGDPWFGRSVKAILNEVDESTAFERPEGQHSILELLWHMITWKEFVISRLRKDNSRPLQHFEEIDWRELDHSNKALWKEGLKEMDRVHRELADVIQQQKDDILYQQVEGRAYDFKTLLNGIVEHDIYHLGQIAYVQKFLRSKYSKSSAP